MKNHETKLATCTSVPTTRFSVAHSKWEMSERACVFFSSSSSSCSVHYFRLNKLGESRRIPVHASAIFRVLHLEWHRMVFLHFSLRLS